MNELVTVALDAMGGDYAPVSIVQGGIEAVNIQPDLKLLLVGDEGKIKQELSKYTYDQQRVEIVPTTEVISNDESPVNAIRTKKDSSLVQCQRLVRSGKADAMVSAGSTGAILAGGQLLVGRIRGIKRAPLAPLIPTAKGFSLLIDCGANVDARAEHLLQFAQIGSIYMEHVMGVKNPRVALVNIGAEEEKGNQLVKETYPMLKECKDINFVGNIEARDIPSGQADVIVCEAFVGNVILKMYEGVSATLMGKIKETLMGSFKTKIGALLIKSSLKETLKQFDATEYGGAPMLGLKGLVVKAHGSSKNAEIKYSVLQCVTFNKKKINLHIEEFLKIK